MSLIQKTIVVIVVLFLGLSALIFASTQLIMMNSFAALEENEVAKDLQRVQDAIQNNLAQMTNQAGDWAIWDDTYEYVENPSQAYIDENAGNDALVRLNYNIVAWIDTVPKLVYASMIDLSSGESVPLPNGFEQQLTATNPLLVHPELDSAHSGLIILPDEAPLMIASRSILTSNGEGPIHGTFLVGRYLDQREIDNLSQLTHLSIAVQKVDDPAISTEFRTAYDQISSGKTTAVQRLSNNIIAGYAVLNDIYGNPAAIIRVTNERKIYQIGQQSRFYLMVVVLAGGCFLVILMFLMLNRMVLRRLLHLRDEVQVIATNGDLSSKIHEPGKDEISQLATSINNLLGYTQEMAAAASRISAGDLTGQIVPRSDKDTLAIAFSGMIENLRSIATQIAASAANLGKASNEMTQAAQTNELATIQIHQTIAQMAHGISQQSANTLTTSDSMNHVVHIIDGIASGAQEQAAAVHRASDSIQAINTALEQVTQKVQTGAKKSEEAYHAAQRGVATVGETIQAIEMIRGKVSILDTSVRNIAKLSQKIEEITETIDEIASQTNLLALNAAIEAARAGEQGKGFAIVADEVRKLAEKSAQATDGINALVKEIHQAIAEATHTMDDSAASVSTGVEMATESRQVLDTIVQSEKIASQSIQEAAAFTEKITASADQMTASVLAVTEVVEKNNAATAEIATSFTSVNQSVSDIANVAAESSTEIEEVTASTQEISDQIQKMNVSLQSLTQMAQELAKVISQFEV